MTWPASGSSGGRRMSDSGWGAPGGSMIAFGMKGALSVWFGAANIAVPGGQANIASCSTKGRASAVA